MRWSLRGAQLRTSRESTIIRGRRSQGQYVVWIYLVVDMVWIYLAAQIKYSMPERKM